MILELEELERHVIFMFWNFYEHVNIMSILFYSVLMKFCTSELQDFVGMLVPAHFNAQHNYVYRQLVASIVWQFGMHVVFHAALLIPVLQSDAQFYESIYFKIFWNEAISVYLATLPHGLRDKPTNIKTVEIFVGIIQIACLSIAWDKYLFMWMKLTFYLHSILGLWNIAQFDWFFHAIVPTDDASKDPCVISFCVFSIICPCVTCYLILVIMPIVHGMLYDPYGGCGFYGFCLLTGVFSNLIYISIVYLGMTVKSYKNGYFAPGSMHSIFSPSETLHHDMATTSPNSDIAKKNWRSEIRSAYYAVKYVTILRKRIIEKRARKENKGHGTSSTNETEPL